MATMPILTAAAEAWKKKAGANYFSRGFLGQYATTGRPVDYAWGCADGQGAVTAGAPINTSVTPNQYYLGRDTFVFIVSKSTKIASNQFFAGTTFGSALGATSNGVYSCSTAAINYMMNGNGGTGYSANAFQAYAYDNNGTTMNGNSVFAQHLGITVGSQAVIATDDQNMVNLVAADPYGIGFCSSAMADPNKVQILGVIDANGASQFYPQTNPKYRWIMPNSSAGLFGGTSSSAAATYGRNLYCQVGGHAAAGGQTGTANLTSFAESMLTTSGTYGSNGSFFGNSLLVGPLFQASYLAL